MLTAGETNEDYAEELFALILQLFCKSEYIKKKSLLKKNLPLKGYY